MSSTESRRLHMAKLKPPTCPDGNTVSSQNVLAVHPISIIHIYEHGLTTTLQPLNTHVAPGLKMMKGFEMIWLLSEFKRRS